jgi:diacylglycerol kinase family enzyme
MRALPAVTATLDAARADYQVAVSTSLDQARNTAERATRLGHVVVAVGGDGLAGALAGAVATAAAGTAATGTAATGTAASGTAAAETGGRTAAAETAARQDADSAGTGCLGIIPAGRGNDLARTLGIPLLAARAAEALTAGAARRVDLIGVTAGGGETIAAASAYAGIPAVAGRVANQIRWPGGRAGYRVAALLALARWAPVPFLADVRLGAGPATEARFAGYAAVVANCAYFGAGLKVAPAAEIDDGQLDLVIMRHGPRIAFLRALARAGDGGHVTLPQVSVHRCTEITITVGRQTEAAADGEGLPGASPLAAGVPLRVRVLPGALRVLGPAGSG